MSEPSDPFQPSVRSHAIVELSGAEKCFGEQQVVAGLDLRIPSGSCFGLLGPNGAGKTTVLRMIYGVTSLSRGSIRVFGLDISARTREVRARLGVTLQDDTFIESLSCVDNLRIFGRYHRLAESVIEARIENLLDFLELRSHAKLLTRDLSGGFRRRVSIAMSLMNDPELLILDEPTTGLDPAMRLALWDRIRMLQAQGKTILLTTHYMDEAERLCDRVAIMDSGRRVEEGSPARLIERCLRAQAVELDCTPDEEEALSAGFPGRLMKIRSGSRLLVYLDDAAPVLEWIKRQDGPTKRPVVVRPTNLEDVFLERTGTALERQS